MSASVDPKNWDALMKLLSEADSSLAKRNTDRIDKSLALFARTTDKLGLKDLEDLAGKFSVFFKQSVLPSWDEEAVATMSFALGALVEKMQRHTYGDAFSSGLSEIHEFLEVYVEEPDGETQAVPDEPEAIKVPEPPPGFPEQKSELLLSPKELETAQFKESIPPARPVGPPQDTVQTPTAIQPPVELPREKPPAKLPKSLDTSPAPSTETTIPPLPIADAPPIPTFDSPQLEAVSHEEHGIPVEDTAPSVVQAEKSVYGPVGDSEGFLLRMLERDPGSHVFVDLAEAFCHEKRWDEVAELCRKGLHLHPRLTRARVLLGWSLLQLGELDESFAALQEARQDLEQNAVLYRLLAELAAARGDADGAAHMDSLYTALSSQGSTTPASGAPKGGAPPSQPRRDRPMAGSVVPFQDPKRRQADLLDALLRRFEGKRTESPSKPDIFPNEVKAALKRLIRAQG